MVLAHEQRPLLFQNGLAWPRSETRARSIRLCNAASGQRPSVGGISVKQTSSDSPSEKISGGVGTTAADSLFCSACDIGGKCKHACKVNDRPDLLAQLHTLRSLAQDIKAQADGSRQWFVAVQCVVISETATLAIDHHNATHDNGQTNTRAFS